MTNKDDWFSAKVHISHADGDDPAWTIGDITYWRYTPHKGPFEHYVIKIHTPKHKHHKHYLHVRSPGPQAHNNDCKSNKDWPEPYYKILGTYDSLPAAQTAYRLYEAAS
jgi:hypothetical protein